MELADITNVIRNLARSRAFTQQSTLPGRESTAKALKSSVELAMATADGLQHTLVHDNANAGTVMDTAESQALVEYLAVRRDVLNIFELEEQAAADDSGGGKDDVDGGTGGRRR